MKKRGNMEKVIKCPVCGQWTQSEIKEYLKTESGTRYVCHTCEAIFFNETPDTKLIYNHEYNLHFCRPSDARKAGIMAEKLATILFRFDHKPVMLEIGAGNGLTALLVEKLGYDVVVNEISGEHCEYLESTLGLFCLKGEFEELKTAMRFDLIYSSHVIEHTTRPHSFAQKLNWLLPKGGIAYIDTPCTDLIHYQGKDWRHFKTRAEYEHVILYSERALRHLLQVNGFSILSCEKFEDYGSMQMIAIRK
jgi:2-polyprenyl-3-methyl-5-hydroxy-6-metoxy-1,4-benzoquinol methylase